MAEIQTNDGLLPPQTLRQLRQVGREFKDVILPQVKARMAFESKSRRKKGPSCRKSYNIRFSPFAMTLDNGLNVRLSTRKSPAVGRVTIPAQTGQLVSVFVIAMVTTDPPVYVLQKVKKKSAPGFPGGGIENGETILGAGAREFKEESRGENLTKGVDIAPYNPICIGKIVLDRAISGEQGAVIFVEIPESEIANLEAGGGDEEGEIVEGISLLTFEEISEKAERRVILPNSVNIWDLYCNYLVSAP